MHHLSFSNSFEFRDKDGVRGFYHYPPSRTSSALVLSVPDAPVEISLSVLVDHGRRKIYQGTDETKAKAILTEYNTLPENTHAQAVIKRKRPVLASGKFFAERKGEVLYVFRERDTSDSLLLFKTHEGFPASAEDSSLISPETTGEVWFERSFGSSVERRFSRFFQTDTIVFLANGKTLVFRESQRGRIVSTEFRWNGSILLKKTCEEFEED